MVLNWASAELARTTATVSGAGARAAAENTSQMGGIVLTIANAIKSIFASGAKTEAGVTGFLAPEIGPAAVPAGIAAAAATIGSSIALVPSLDVGSWSLPRDMLVRAHAGEMVVPAAQTPWAQRLLAAGGGGGGGGGGTNHITINFAANGRLTEAEIKQHAQILAETVGDHLRVNQRTRQKHWQY